MDEKENVRLKSRYDLLKTVVEKLLIGGIISLVVFFGHKMLEEHRSSLIRNRFS